jgi:hypothetical protein
VNPAVQAQHTVAGRLAAFNVSDVVSGSFYKSYWSFRDAPAQPTLELVASRDETGEQHLHFVATPFTGESDSTGLLAWGPTYYVEFVLPRPGCWRVSVHGHNVPRDAIVLRVR